MPDNSPIIAERAAPVVPTLEGALKEFNDAVPPPTLESLLAEFSRGVGSDKSARQAADMIRARDNPPEPEPAAPSAAPEPAEPATPPEPEIVFPEFAPPWLAEARQAQQEQEIDAAVSSALEHLKGAGVDDGIARDKLNAILTTDQGFQAFERRDYAPKAWQAMLEKGRSSIEAALDAAAAARHTRYVGDVSAARAAVANQAHSPIPEQGPSLREKANMSDRQWTEYLAEKTRQQPQRR